MAIEPNRPDRPKSNRMFDSTSTGGMGFERTHSADQLFDGILIEDFPARFISIYRYAPSTSHQLLSHSSPIPHLFLTQLFTRMP